MAIVADKFYAEDSGTNTVVTIMEIAHKSSGTPASGLGAAIELGAEDSAGNVEFGVQIQGYLSTVTNGAEQGAFLMRLKNSGTYMDALAITVAANTVTIGSNQTTVNLWNTTATTVNAWGVATAITIGATASVTTTIRGGTLVGNTTTQNVFTTTATTVNAFQAATTLNMGNSSGATALAGTLDVSGTVAFGNNASISTTIAMNTNHLYSTTSGTLRAGATTCSLNPSGTSTADCYGLQAAIAVNTAQTFSGILAGLRGFINPTAAATVSRGHGVIAELQKTAGTITDYRGFYSYDTSTGTTVTTAYGIYLDELGAGTTEYGLYVADLNDAGTNYAIYTNAGAVRFGDSVTIADAKNIIFDTTTGTKIGTATTQKLAFYNSTPIVQQSSTGETVGFTAGAGTNVTDQSTFTGNVGSTAYRISDVVKHLKNLGLIAA